MDWISALHVELFHAINRLSDNVHHTALDLLTCGHGDRTAGLHNLQSALQAIGVIHSHTTHGVLADVLLDLNDEFLAIGAGDLKSIMNLWQNLLSVLACGVKIDINYRTDNLGDSPINLCHIIMFRINFFRMQK